MPVHVTYDDNGEVTSVCFSEMEDYVEPELQISLAVDEVDVKDLAMWIRKCTNAYTPTQALQIAGVMIRNRENWYPEYHTFDLTKGNPYCVIKVTSQLGNRIISRDLP